jgi:hypothetical protein
MARTARDIEAYLNQLGRRYQVLSDGTFAIDSGPSTPAIAVRVAVPMVEVRVLIGDGPKDNETAELALFRKMLQLNATELLFCAYGLVGQQIVLGSALELENLDLNELEAVLGDIDLALARHVPLLRELSKA